MTEDFPWPSIHIPGCAEMSSFIVQGKINHNGTIVYLYSLHISRHQVNAFTEYLFPNAHSQYSVFLTKRCIKIGIFDH